MSWTRQPEAVLILAAVLASPVSAAPAVILAIPEDISAIDMRPAAYLLIRNGAPAAMTVLPSGRINTVMREENPACRLEVVYNPAKHPNFQWVAKTASIDYVAAGLTGDAAHPPGPHTTAVVAMNTVAQTLAAKAGYEVLPVRSQAAGIPLLQSGRASVIVAARQEVENLAATGNVNLHVETVLAHADTWLACNAHVEDEDVQRIAEAWRKGIVSGELRTYYAKAGIPSLYPEP